MGRFLPAAAAFALFGSLVAALPASANAQSVRTEISGSEIKQLLESAGHAPTMSVDKRTGAPVAVAQTGGLVFVVRGLDCRGVPAKCQQLLFLTNFDLNREITGDDFRIVNSFNDSSIEGRAYVIDKREQIGVDFIIDMTGGVTGEHIGSRLGRWPEVIRDFRDEMVRAHNGS